MKNRLLYGLMFFLAISFRFSQLNAVFEEKPLVVVIASYNNSEWYQWNLDSVFQQAYSNYRVVYIDDCSSDRTADLVEAYVTARGQWHRFTMIRNTTRKLKMANTYMAYHEYCKDNEIVVELDGDDPLMHPLVFANINKKYSTGVWMTYGHFVECPSGAPQIMRAIPQSAIDNRTVRKLPGCMWAGLRTYYAWLVKQVKLEDLLYNGQFLPYTSDAAIMFPMFDMSGNHFSFVTDDMWLIHNVLSSLNDHKVDTHGTSATICDIARNRQPYERLSRPRFGFFDACEQEKADVAVLSRDQSQALLESVKCHVQGAGQLFVVSDVQEAVQKTQSRYLLVVSDEYIFNHDVNLGACIRALEETQACGVFFGLGKDRTDVPVYVDGFGGLYAWQLRYGTGQWSNPHSTRVALYRKSDLVGVNKHNAHPDRVGLFFDTAQVVKIH